MNKQVLIGIILAIVVIGGVAVYASSSSNKNTVQDSSESGDAMMKDEKLKENEAMMEKDKMESDAMMKDEKMESDKMMEGDAVEKDSMQRSGSYKDYSQATVDTEQKAGNKVVLFFHAPWCPECKAADAAFKANLDKIPAGVTLLKTDYDSNVELKKKYAVTYQHTFVQVDNNENLVTKWISGDVDMLTKNVK